MNYFAITKESIMETSKKHTKHVFPHKIMEYINAQYTSCNLVDIKEEEEEMGGHVRYKLAVAEGADIHHLEFNELGNIVSERTELKFARPRHEDFLRDQGLYEQN